MLKEYTYLFFYCFFCFVIVSFLLIASLWIVQQKTGMEKSSAYECGFNPFDDVRSKFEIRFFLVGLLFIVFDLEIAFLLPWVVIVTQGVSFTSLFILLFFLIFLVFCFFFEWTKGALDWE